MVVEYKRRAGESPVVRTEDIECGGVGGGGVPLTVAVAGSGAVVVGWCISGAASLCPGMCDESWSSNVFAPAANDKCLPSCCGDEEDEEADAIGNTAAKSLDGAVLPAVLRSVRCSICIGTGRR